MLEDCSASRSPVAVREPHFRVLPEFVGASYARRYELFCRKLVLERHYTSAAFIVSDRKEGPSGAYQTPAPDLSIEEFGKALAAHVARFV